MKRTGIRSWVGGGGGEQNERMRSMGGEAVVKCKGKHTVFNKQGKGISMGTSMDDIARNSPAARRVRERRGRPTDGSTTSAAESEGIRRRNGHHQISDRFP